MDKDNMTEKERLGKILSIVKKDYDSTKSSKNRVDSNLSRWVKQYNGDPYGNEVNGRSKIVVKDIKKQVKTIAPSIVDPFMNTKSLVKAKPKTLGAEASASYNADILNYQYNNDFPKLHFIKTIASILPKEGNVFIKTGWEFSEDVKKKTISGLNEAELLALRDSIDEIEDVSQDKNGKYKLTAVKRTTITNKPTAIVCRNEDIFTDPTAEKFEDCKFVVHQYRKSISDIKKQKSIYNLDIDYSALEKTTSDVTPMENAMAQTRYNNTYNNGLDPNYRFAADTSKKVAILEYWGEYDLNDDGINEQIVIAWVKDTDIVLRCEENPFPDKEIPFCHCLYDLEAFSVWGNAMADLIGDNQMIHTAIMRGFIDNLSLANNGQKIIRKGAIDYINLSKLQRGEKYIEVNDMEGIKDGSYNQIPSSTFGVYDMVTQEAEMLTGVGRNFDGVDDATIGRTAAGVNMVMNAAQKHVNLLILTIAEMYKAMFTKWYKYNQAFLDEGQAIEISGELASVAKSQMNGTYNIELNINVDSMNQQKIQQINMLLQQSRELGENLPEWVIPSLVAEIFDAFGKNEEAEKLRAYKPEPNEFQQKMMMLEMELKQAEIQLKIAQAQAETAKAKNTTAQAVGHVAKADKIGIETLSAQKDLELKDDSRDLELLKKGAEVDKMQGEIQNLKKEKGK